MILRGTLTALGGLLALNLLLAGDHGRALAAQQPESTTGLETIQIRENVWAIFGAGSNVTVHVGHHGAIVVDSGTSAMADALLNAIQEITDSPIRLIINTSADADHVGGNQTLSASGVAVNPDNFSDEESSTILAHENVLLRMSAFNGTESLFPLDAWPTETYTARTRSMYINDEAVQVLRSIGAHTDGDSMVFLRRSDVIATGDVIDLRQFPVIDTSRGGSIQGELDALNQLLELTLPAMPFVLEPSRTLLVPGHGRVSDYSELVEYRDMVTVIRDIVEHYMGQGMTLDEVKAANPTAGYRGRYGSDTGPWTTDMFVEAVYSGLEAQMEKP